MRKIRKITVTVFVLISMILSMTSVAWAKVSDVKGHWAETQINDWVEKGLVKGYSDGTFRPENPISRAEFCALLNRAFGFVRKSSITFTDVSSKDWFADDISKAIAQGYLTGFPDKTAGPNRNITRQEVVTILARVLKLKINENAVSKYADTSKFAAWAKGSIIAVSELGYVNTYADNTFRPDANATRDEVVYILARATGVLYNKAGAYGPGTGTSEVTGNVTISKPDIILKNTAIKGNLYLTEGIGEGSVTLEKVTVSGTTTICGGGEHGIISIGSTLGTLVNEPEKGKTRLAVNSATTVASTAAAVTTTTPSGGGGGGGGGGSGGGDTTPITVTSVATLAAIQIVYGTTISAIGLSDTITVNLSNNTRQSARVSWSSSTYNPSAAGTYSFTGIITPQAGVTNPSNHTASINVIVAPEPVTIINIGGLTDQFVGYGTTIGAITLPETVTLNLSDLTARQANVTWNRSASAYNSNAGGTYPIPGTFAVPEGIVCPDNTVNINVTVVVGFAAETIADKYVVKGTAVADVRLPASVVIHLQNGSANTAGIVWNTSGLNTNAVGMYTLTGTLTMPAGVENRNNTGISMRVFVVQPVIDPRPDTPVVSSAGTIINEFDSIGAGISSTEGILEVDTQNKVSGAASINITSNITTTAGSFSLDYTAANMDLSSMTNLQFSFYTPDLSQINRVAIWLYSDSGGYFSRLNAAWRLVEGWNRISIGRNEFIENKRYATDTPSFSNINRIRILFYPENGCKPSVNVDRISYNMQARPKVLFTFDDGWYDLIDSSITDNAFSYMTSKGFRGTVWAKSSSSELSGSTHVMENGVPAYMNETDLDRLYDAGWDIGNHTVNHPNDINNFSDFQLENEYLQNQDWLLSKNWSRGAHFAAYPSGDYNERLIEILQSIGVLAARTTVCGTQSNPVDNMFKLKCIYLDQTLNTAENPGGAMAQVRRDIDHAIQTGSSVIFMIHKVENSQHPLAMSVNDFKSIVDYVDQRRSSIDVVTMSEWYNTYAGLPQQQVTISSVNRISDMNVAYGTTTGAIALPAQVQVTLSDRRTTSLPVNWNTSGYNPNAAGTYTLTGTFVLPGGITNPANRTASVRIIVGEQPVRTITGVAAIPDINAAYGTTIGAIALPERVQVNLSNSTTAALGVNWDTSTYNPAVTGICTLTGTITLEPGITNPTNRTASVRIIVGVQPVREITGVATYAAISVDYGTTISAITLPEHAQVNLSNSTTAELDVTWDTSTYRPNTAGTYTFTGELTLVTGIANTANYTASISIVVGALSITAVEDIEDIHVPFGTTEVAVDYLPDTVNVTLSDGSVQALNVTWTSETYDADVPGANPFTGTLELTVDITNPANRRALVNIIVDPAPVI